MKAKRILFIVSLIALFGVCFTIMNKHYDELARYPYVTNENREIILEHLSSDDINYMVSQQLKPEQFLPFIEVKDFQIRNTLWYSRAKELQEASNEAIVKFINDFKNRMEYSSLETLLQSYSYDTLRTFYEADNEYVHNASIVSDPAAMFARIEEDETLYTYEPNDLISIDLPHVSLIEGRNDVTIKAEVYEPLQQLCDNISSVNDKTCGDLIVTAGYISYEEQIPLFESMMLKYGKDGFVKYWDYPGQSEYQLGYTIRFQPAGREDAKIDDNNIYDKGEENADPEAADSDEKELAVWLEENAYKYGFVVRYPKGKEKLTGKEYQPFTLRYVGITVAKDLHDKGQVLDEFTFQVK